jgi:hypothetical protein
MSSTSASDRKRKPPAEVPEAVVSIDNQSKSKARRVSTDASASLDANSPVRAVATSTADTASASDVERSESMESVGASIQDLFHSDNVKVKAALDALYQDLHENEKRDIFVAAGGYVAVVQVVRDCLKTGKILAYARVTKLSALDELRTLDKSLALILYLTRHPNEISNGISSVGGVEAVVKVMKAFPKCLALQASACVVLCNLSHCSIGNRKAVASGSMDVLLAAVKNILNSTEVCHAACLALSRIIATSKENTALFNSSGGVTTVAKVKMDYPDDNGVREAIRLLMIPVLKELNFWKNKSRKHTSRARSVLLYKGKILVVRNCLLRPKHDS